MENGTPEPTLYQKYLGISGNQIPPNHYTLLGIQPLESDPETIQKAAQKRAECLRQQKTDENLAELQALMNEIAAARLCLLNDSRRKEYESFITGQKTSGVQMASPFAAQQEPEPEETTNPAANPGVNPVVNPAVNPGANPFNAQTPQTVDPMTFQQQTTPQTMDPMLFQQQQAQQMAAQQMAAQQMTAQQMAAQQMTAQQMAAQQMTAQQMAAQQMAAQQMAAQQMTAQQIYQQQMGQPFPQQVANPMAFQQQPQMEQGGWPQTGAPLSMGNPNGIAGDFGQTGAFGQADGGSFKPAPKASRKNTQRTKKSSNNFGWIIGGVLLIITVALGYVTWNSDSSRANRLYIESQSAVNRQDFDEGRRLVEQAIQLDKKDEYVRYREAIDVKEKKYQKRLRHEKARAEEDDFAF